MRCENILKLKEYNNFLYKKKGLYILPATKSVQHSSIIFTLNSSLSSINHIVAKQLELTRIKNQLSYRRKRTQQANTRKDHHYNDIDPVSE
ncbi:hypothetical protein Hanom_Chr13g01218551 [Helianthus anomalus]